MKIFAIYGNFLHGNKVANHCKFATIGYYHRNHAALIFLKRLKLHSALQQASASQAQAQAQARAFLQSASHTHIDTV